jgi:hypothetical protein
VQAPASPANSPKLINKNTQSLQDLGIGSTCESDFQQVQMPEIPTLDCSTIHVIPSPFKLSLTSSRARPSHRVGISWSGGPDRPDRASGQGRSSKEQGWPVRSFILSLLRPQISLRPHSDVVWSSQYTIDPSCTVRAIAIKQDCQSILPTSNDNIQRGLVLHHMSLGNPSRHQDAQVPASSVFYCSSWCKLRSHLRRPSTINKREYEAAIQTVSILSS